MIPMNPAAVAAVALIFLGLHVNASNVDYNNPVRTAKKDEVKISGNFRESSKFRFFAGYLEASADGEPEQFLYYWFLERQLKPSPIVLALNGGPGSSSLMRALGPTGPIKVKDGNVSLVDRNYSWNNNASMLYIEGPVGVGYSYSPNSTNFVESTDKSIAKSTFLALKRFMQKFPHLAKTPLYLTGVSQAGIYLPTLAGLVYRDFELNLKGVVIEDGIFNHTMHDIVWNMMSWYSNFTHIEDMDEISEHCCQGGKVVEGNCNFNRMSKKCFHTIDQIYRQFLGSGLEMFNIYSTREPDWLLHNEIRNNNNNLKLERSFERHECKACNGTEKLSDCTTLWSDFIPLNDETKGLLNIPLSLKRVEVIRYCLRRDNNQMDLVNQVKSLFIPKRNLAMCFLEGGTNMQFDFLGTHKFVDSLDRKLLIDYKSWNTSDGTIGGFSKQYEGLTYATVLSAGHSPSTRNPKFAHWIVSEFIHSKVHRHMKDLDSKE